ncbi:MAG: hypothetical protein KAH57_05710 [Thermoplasmata archaeon]|nr:hypothetical protein [Thermoplasmata archaeon]
MKGGMSELEHRIYFSLLEKDQRIFTINYITKNLNISEYHARNIASSLVKKGAAERIKAGLFARTPGKRILNRKLYHEDSILIGSSLCRDYFFSHYTAVNIHGLANRYFNTIHISSPTHYRDLEYHDNIIKFVKITRGRMFGIKTIPYLNRSIFVSDIERTLLDIVNRPSLSGGWFELIDIIRNIERIDEGRLSDHILEFNNKKTARVLGYFLQMIERTDISDHMLEKMISFSGRNNYYLEKVRGGTLNREWNLIVPDRIRKVLNDR